MHKRTDTLWDSGYRSSLIDEVRERMMPIDMNTLDTPVAEVRMQRTSVTEKASPYYSGPFYSPAKKLALVERRCRLLER